MPQTYKQGGQAYPAANTDTTLYTVPSGTQAVVSALTIANNGTGAAKVRVAVRINGAALTWASGQLKVPDVSLGANDAMPVLQNAALAAGDVVAVRADTSSVAFSIDVCEIT